MAVFNEELMKKARAAESVEELMALAKENDIELTRETAEEYFESLNQSGEMSDEEMDNVAGGGCGSSSGSDLRQEGYKCPQCGSDNIELCAISGGKLPILTCSACGYTDSECRFIKAEK